MMLELVPTETSGTQTLGPEQHPSEEVGGQSLQSLLRGDGNVGGSWDGGEPATSRLSPPFPACCFSELRHVPLHVLHSFPYSLIHK